MADVKISQLTEVAASAGADLVECVQAGASRRTTVQKLLDWIKAQATTWTGKQTFQGYTVLGESSPAIKCKVLTGVTPATEGGATSVAHGINAEKILSVTGAIKNSGGFFVPPGDFFNEQSWGIYYGSADISVSLHATNSASLLSRPFKIFVVYEE